MRTCALHSQRDRPGTHTGSCAHHDSVYTGTCKVNAFKDLLRSHDAYPCQFIDKFPDQPRDLPKEVHDHAYPTSPPIARHIHNFDAITRHIPLRKNSKLLQQCDSHHQHGEPRNRNDILGAVVALLQQQGGGRTTDDDIPITLFPPRASRRRSSPDAPQRSLSYADEWWTPPDSTRKALTDSEPPSTRRYASPERSPTASPVDASSFKPVPRVKRTASEHHVSDEPGDGDDIGKDHHTAAGSSDDVSGNATRTPVAVRDKLPTSEDIEEAAFNRLVGKADTAKAKAKAAQVAKNKIIAEEKAKVKADAAAAKAAAAAKSQVRKRMRVKQPPMQVKACKVGGRFAAAAQLECVFPIVYTVAWEDGDSSRVRNTFTCKHYNRANTILKKIQPPVPTDVRKATLASVLAAAGAMYEKNMVAPGSDKTK